MPLTSLSPIPLKNVEFRDGTEASLVCLLFRESVWSMVITKFFARKFPLLICEDFRAHEMRMVGVIMMLPNVRLKSSSLCEEKRALMDVLEEPTALGSTIATCLCCRGGGTGPADPATAGPTGLTNHAYLPTSGGTERPPLWIHSYVLGTRLEGKSVYESSCIAAKLECVWRT